MNTSNMQTTEKDEVHSASVIPAKSGDKIADPDTRESPRGFPEENAFGDPREMSNPDSITVNVEFSPICILLNSCVF